MVTDPEHWSVPTGVVKVTTAPALLVPGTEIFAGHEIEGPSISVTVTVKVSCVVLPAVSVAT